MRSDTIPRPTAPRIAPIDIADLTAEQRKLLVGASTVVQVLAHRDELLGAWITFAGRVISDSPLTGRDRELVILRVALRTRCAYEWANHTVAAQMYGLSVSEVCALADETATWSDSDAVLLAAVDELCADNALSDPTWAALRHTLDEGAILSLIMLIGFYQMTAGVLNGVGVQPEDGRPPLGEPYKPGASIPTAPASPTTATGLAKVSGTWAVTFHHPAGDQRLTLRLAVEDTTLTGTVSSPALGIDVDLTDGVADGGHITGASHITTPFDMSLGWDGHVVDDTIAGQVEVPGAGAYPFDGTRE
ncbi:carboxymuconolactone decarboxylase family protein [Pseudonocardia spinosispora]|uniref:carboxymuconolactone decarboxylase family protein n=1 Tax=Pseudonocardia spinosispora TaxID=103441 RepID=UPI0004009B7B|nr:carboxymuconolactone decarboxylase family protein [Pseudonocardia spinosispora]